MEAILKIYTDLNCSNEVPITDGKYVIPEKDFSSTVTGSNVFTRILYIKNVGDFKAYAIDNTYVSTRCTIVVEKASLEPNEVSKITISYTITENEDVEGETLSFTIKYNHLENCDGIDNTYAEIKNRFVSAIEGLTYATLNDSLRQSTTDSTYNIYAPFNAYKTIIIEIKTNYERIVEV